MSALSRCMHVHMVHQPIQQSSHKTVAWISCHWKSIFSPLNLLLILVFGKTTFQSSQLQTATETRTVKTNFLSWLKRTRKSLPRTPCLGLLRWKQCASIIWDFSALLCMHIYFGFILWGAGYVRQAFTMMLISSPGRNCPLTDCGWSYSKSAKLQACTKRHQRWQ